MLYEACYENQNFGPMSNLSAEMLHLTADLLRLQVLHIYYQKTTRTTSLTTDLQELHIYYKRL